jgi:hypothetical protein
MPHKIKNYLVSGALALGLLMTCFLASAFAAGAAATDGSSPLGDVLSAVLSAFRGKDYDYAGALAIVALAAVFRQYGSKFPGKLGAFFSGEWGALTIVAMTAFAGSVAAQVAGPQGITLAILSTALSLTWKAASGYGLVKKFLYPLLVKLRAKLPGWAQSLLDVVLWFFDGGQAKATAKAEAAGAEAVKANPSKGAAGVVGEPVDFS